MSRKFINDHQVAEMLGVSERTIARYVAQGLIKGYRIGPKLIRFDSDEVEAALVSDR